MFEPCFLYFMANRIAPLHIDDRRRRCAALSFTLWDLPAVHTKRGFLLLSLSVFSILRNILTFMLWLEMPGSGFLYLLCNNLT